MSRKLIAGNWKMNGRLADVNAFAAALTAGREATQAASELLVCPPFTLIPAMHEAFADRGVKIGAQDCHSAAKGAHTGDISAAMLADLGCDYVIVGHSERRQAHGETSADVAAKARAAIDAGLSPIVCIGETGAQRDAGEALAVLDEQLKDSLPADILRMAVVAYEPVWAIGTGRTPKASDIGTVHRHLRAHLESRIGPEGVAIRLLYGGSVKAANAAEILAIPEVGGALAGGASLDASALLAIAQAAESE